MEIQSTSNERIKNIVRLQTKSKERKKQRLFVVEGDQENAMALQNNWELESCYVLKDTFNEAFSLPQKPIYVNQKVFSKIAIRQNTGGIVGVYKSKTNGINDFVAKPKGIYIILEGIEKPGNLGAILRSCDAAAVDAIFITNAKADVFNPNTVRSSVGTIFSSTIFTASQEEILAKLEQQHVKLFATYLGSNTQNIYTAQWENSVGFVMGTEAHGISPFWIRENIIALKIPMLGKVDSLNVSTAAAVCVYEARRRHSFS